MHSADIQKLKNWFLSQHREFPWRNHPTPYAVWISEVMLQQTRASVVIPYFERWMDVFPDVESLARADLDVVIKEWEGLGYYSRARNLHEGAKYLLENHGGQIPSVESELKKIKGLGPYTISAILSFAFHQRKAAIDGNVLRVLARYYDIHDDFSKSHSLKKIQLLGEEFLPLDEPWVISEALIELGATICSRNPKCVECALKGSCAAFANGTAEGLPFKSSKKSSSLLYRTAAIIMHQDVVLIQRVPKGKIMSDLYEFPYFEFDQKNVDARVLKQHLWDLWQLSAEWRDTLSIVRHSFTRYRVRLLSHLFSTDQAKMIPGYIWMPIKELRNLPFSSGHRRVLDLILASLDPFRN